jgi:hypothetical protein
MQKVPNTRQVVVQHFMFMLVEQEVNQMVVGMVER